MEKPKIIKDLGMKYPTERSKKKARRGLYLCPYCGKEFESWTNNVNRGHATSCGCTRTVGRIKHGKSRCRIYKIWSNIKGRCLNANDKDYNTYGGRGITVCAEWERDFIAFYDWTIKNGYRKGLEIDRIDNDSGYSPDNCRITTRLVNAENTRLLYKDNTSGYRGVSWRKDANLWQAAICWNGRLKLLGYSKSKLGAARKYNDFVIKNKTHHPINPIPDEDTD